MKLNRLTLLKIDLASDKINAICTICGDALAVPHGVNFKVHSVMINGRSVVVKKPEKLIKDFLELHFGKHSDKGIKWDKEKAAI